jgi:hypothetical protein
MLSATARRNGAMKMGLRLERRLHRMMTEALPSAARTVPTVGMFLLLSTELLPLLHIAASQSQRMAIALLAAHSLLANADEMIK